MHDVTGGGFNKWPDWRNGFDPSQLPETSSSKKNHQFKVVIHFFLVVKTSPVFVYTFVTYWSYQPVAPERSSGKF